MNHPTSRLRRASGLGLAALTLVGAAAVTTLGAAAPAEAVVDDTVAGSCIVTDGTMSWGVKESFRSYISGSIANGEWAATEGATYETPEFTWTGGAGEIDPETGTGSVSFVGTVSFTGHSGALDLTLTNPTLEFEGDGQATLLLDSRSTNPSGEVVLDSQQEWIGDVTAPASLAPADDALALTDMPTTLTNAGVKAFAEFYDAGAELDPLTVNLVFDGCDTAAAPMVEGDGVMTTQTSETIQAEQSIPWLPIGIGAVAIAVIGITVGMLVGGRKRPGAAPATPASGEQPGQAAPNASQQPSDPTQTGRLFDE